MTDPPEGPPPVIVVHVIAALFGVVLVMAVLISALETVVLPRDGFTRIARCVFAVADRILVHRWRNLATPGQPPGALRARLLWSVCRWCG